MAFLLLSNVEYVTLRLVRRFLLPKALHRWGRYLPYYRINLSETQPEHTYRLYARWLAVAGCSLAGRRVVEVGSGATNGAGYELACAGTTRVWCVEPYVEFDHDKDAALLAQIARANNQDAAKIAAEVSRCSSLDSVGAGNADIILSHSVLEHVRDLEALFSQMSIALTKGGAMLHVVDYRDHFFKYPLHFLQFSPQSWRRFLDPGDLPRWRLGHHRLALERAGFDVRILYQEADAAEFERIRPHISSHFDLTDPSVGILHAVLYCERAQSLSNRDTA